MKTTILCWLRYGIAAAITLGGLAGCGSDNNGGSSTPVQIIPLSNRADLVSGGNALVEIVLPNPQAGGLKVEVDGRDVTGAFAVRSDNRMKGVITGLANGDNVVTASVFGSPAGRLTLTNHPIGGPVLLSAQTTPWVCATPVAVAPTPTTPGSNASGLTTAAVDAQCNIVTEIKLFYHTTTPGCLSSIFIDPSGLPDPSPPAVAAANNCFKPFTLGSTPADLATITTPDGVTVPYIVRVERGTINRGIYDIAVLFDPTKPTWTAIAPQPQWNRKVLYSFGASTGQPRLQFRSEQNWADDLALSRGFMVVDNSLTDSLFNSNRILVNETLMMMKEHIVDNYGEIKYTMGNGCSGGSIGQNTVASTFPGLLDGIQPSCDFPDSITTGIEVTDCVLLVNAYVNPAWTALMVSQGLTQAQINAKKTAINGHLDQLGCQSWNNSFGFNNKPGNYIPTFILPADTATGALTPFPPAATNNCKLPAALVYDPVTNPTGPRCGDPDLAAAVWGTTAGIPAGSTRALSTNDNIGVQYGLKALLAVAITPEEFVTLNEKIGGVDADSNATLARSAADLPALDIAYKSGIVASGKNLAKLPIIDSRGWDEQGIHYIWRSFSERARIDADNAGNHGNQVMWRYGTGLLPATAAQFLAVTAPAFLTMDAWLSSLLISAPKASLNDVRTQAQVIAAKPAVAVDKCFLTVPPDPTFSTPVFDQALCDADPRLVKHSSPHQVAGGPLTENILKCQLKPLVASDYTGITFTAGQLTRLNAVFPTGVCDWSRPGVGQQDAVSPQTYSAGPGGQPLGAAPVSQGM
jgi:Tannase-like family of unknown function (DUF6351)